MILKSTPTGDAFFDPPPSDQTAATLVLGSERLDCRLAEVSLGGFVVTLPLSKAWTGDVVCKLLTHDAAYQVRIVRQEPEVGGFRFTLQTINMDEAELADQLGAMKRWVVYASRSIAIGLVIGITYCYLVVPGGNSSHAKIVQPQDVVAYLSRILSPAELFLNQSASNDAESTQGKSEGLADMPAISVSLDGASKKPGADGSQSGTAESSEDAQAREVLIATRLALLKQSLQVARREPVVRADASTLPWLFRTGLPSSQNRWSYRMSISARNDLTIFHEGLSSLPTSVAADATRSLRKALSEAPTSPAVLFPFESFAEVRMVRSDDAEVYFRLGDGAVDLLRVVPRIDLEPIATSSATARSTLPTRSANR